MSVLAVVSTSNSVDGPSSAPRRIVSALDSIQLEVVHIARDGFAAIPYVWVREVAPESFEGVLRDDPKILDLDRLDQGDDGSFYKIWWQVDSPLIHCLVEAGGLVLEAQGTPAEWSLKLWFEDRTGASSFQQCCERADVPLDIKRLSSITGEFAGESDALTEAQRETLLLALERGYYEEPRGVSQQELAEELDVSPNAVGRLLRRAHRNLITTTVSE